MTSHDPTCSGCLPDIRTRFFGQKSGFLKTSFLKSVWFKKFFEKKFFPDKTIPGSGFALKRPVFQIYLNLTHKYIQNGELSCFPISGIHPDIRIRILFALRDHSLKRIFRLVRIFEDKICQKVAITS